MLYWSALTIVEEGEDDDDDRTIIMPQTKPDTRADTKPTKIPFNPKVKLESDQNPYKISDKKTGERKDKKLIDDYVRQINDFIANYTKEVKNEPDPSEQARMRKQLKELKAMKTKAQVRGVIKK